MAKNNNEYSTRERLLDAAGRLFAEKGFDATGIREICEKADANVASVNYHFGDKEKLYEAVVSGIFGQAEERYPLAASTATDTTPEEKLHDFILLGRNKSTEHTTFVFFVNDVLGDIDQTAAIGVEAIITVLGHNIVKAPQVTPDLLQTGLQILITEGNARVGYGDDAAFLEKLLRAVETQQRTESPCARTG